MQLWVGTRQAEDRAVGTINSESGISPSALAATRSVESHHPFPRTQAARMWAVSLRTGKQYAAEKPFEMRLQFSLLKVWPTQPPQTNPRNLAISIRRNSKGLKIKKKLFVAYPIFFSWRKWIKSDIIHQRLILIVHLLVLKFQISCMYVGSCSSRRLSMPTLISSSHRASLKYSVSILQVREARFKKGIEIPVVKNWVKSCDVPHISSHHSLYYIVPQNTLPGLSR